MSKTVVLGIDAWYPQVDGVTNVVANYRTELEKKDWNCAIVAPSYGKKRDKQGEEEYCGEVFHNRSLAVPFLSFRNSTPGTDVKLKKYLDELKPDILHAHSPFAICAYFVRYAKKRGVAAGSGLLKRRRAAKSAPPGGRCPASKQNRRPLPFLSDVKIPFFSGLLIQSARPSERRGR